MSCRIYIENPPPFRYAPRGPSGELVAASMSEGIATVQCYLDAGLEFTGLHHSDLDRYEARRLRNDMHLERYDTFDYAGAVREALGGFHGRLIPHRVVVYDSPETQMAAFRRLARHGIRDVVLVGKPFSVHPQGLHYQTTVEQMLAYLASKQPGLSLGAIGIPTRRNEAERIADKFQAAGGFLRVMGQFHDEIDSMPAFMKELVDVFERRRLDLGALEWNAGLAMFTLKERGFYARLLRKERLACEDRFAGLATIRERIEASVGMDLEFAERLKGQADRLGIDLGFSLQPIIERYLDGSTHPAVEGIILLARKLASLCSKRPSMTD